VRVWTPKAVGLEHIAIAALEKDLEFLPTGESRIRVYGKWHDMPRDIAAYGDAGTQYTFSGLTVVAKPWTDLVTSFKTTVERLVGCEFNFCLVNRYQSGKNYIGKHRDDQPGLDPSFPIASLSFGCPRDFVLEPSDNGGSGGQKVVQTLAHGMLLTMDPPTNTFWKHSVPKRMRETRARINFTFRRIRPSLDSIDASS
jgi:DNA oxidative demethylase